MAAFRVALPVLALLAAVVTTAWIVSWVVTRLDLTWEGRIDPSPPHLNALAGDGDVSLAWSIADSQLLGRVQYWEYRHSPDGQPATGTRSTESSATNHRVSDLTNGVAYSFQVRAVWKQGGFGGWSNTAVATPRRVGNLLERMEQHLQSVAKLQEHMVGSQADISREQGRIADAVSEMAGLAADRGKSIRRLADDGVRALETLASSSVSTTEELAGMRGAITAVSSSIASVGERIGSGLSGIREQLATLPSSTPLVAEYCGTGAVVLEVLYFDHNSATVDGQEHPENAGKIRGVVGMLESAQGGLILTVGHATAVGLHVYNTQLSNQRAACVSRCIHDGFAGGGDAEVRFEFREVAEGEAQVARDPAGNGDWSRRVEVVWCPNVARVPGRYSGVFSNEMPAASACGCPVVS